MLGIEAARARLADVVAQAEAALAPFGERAANPGETGPLIAAREK